MQSNPTRRAFLSAIAALSAVPALPAFATQKFAGIRFGYTAMTWGDDERPAIVDIAAVGFAGVQFRANALADFKPAELKDLLARSRLSHFRAAMYPWKSSPPTTSLCTQRMRNSQKNAEDVIFKFSTSSRLIRAR
jgi:hypothetical protein